MESDQESECTFESPTSEKPLFESPISENLKDEKTLFENPTSENFSEDKGERYVRIHSSWTCSSKLFGSRWTGGHFVL